MNGDNDDDDNDKDALLTSTSTIITTTTTITKMKTCPQSKAQLNVSPLHYYETPNTEQI